MAEARVILPTFHRAQAEIYRNRARFNVLRCGRRFGKDIMMITMAADDAARGKRAGLFAPEYKQLIEPFDALDEILAPIRKRASRNEGSIRTKSGGVVDFWYLDDNELAGRGREYDCVYINEAAFSKSPDTIDIWKKSIRPTLLTRRGSAWVFGTPKGIDPENFFYACCTDPKYGFKEFHVPSNANPYVPPEEFERERLSNDPLIFQQEFLAEFVDWSGHAFFERDKLLVDGQPVKAPTQCDAVFAVLDTAVKTGKEHDATAVLFCARSRFGGHPLVLLDWDILQIEGSLLETWLPTVYERLESFAKACGARMGSLGAFIEDKASGTILLQQAARRGWQARAIDSKLTAVGKDERAIAVSGHVYKGMVKLSDQAFTKTSTYKGATRNHLLGQVIGFRIGDKDATRQDDLLDTFCYAAAIALGDE